MKEAKIVMQLPIKTTKVLLIKDAMILINISSKAANNNTFHSSSKFKKWVKIYIMLKRKASM